MADIPINQIKIIEEKLRVYGKPFIDNVLLQKILQKFAPSYKPFQLSARWLISVVKNGKLYKNNLYRWYVSRYAILGLYMQDTTYMIGWLYLYNKYRLSTQLPNRITVYNTVYSGQREIAWAKIIFKRVRISFFRGKEKRKSIKESQGVAYYRMSPERALIQLLIDTKGRPEFADDIYYQLQQGNIDTKRVLDLMKKYVIPSKQHFICQFITLWYKI